MSIELHVYLRDSDVPSREQWQGAINDAGFDLELDELFSMRDHIGYVPVQLCGVESGFEFYLDPLDKSSVPESISMALANYDRVAAFRVGGDLEEFIAAMCAAAALTQLADGVFHDAQTYDEYLNGAEAIAWAMETAEQEGVAIALDSG
jgi:hypothetical protein